MNEGREKTRELLDQLKEGIANVKDSEQFKAVLKAMSVFNDYSFNNSMLIIMQCPEASKVAGYRTWQKLGRQVKKGSKAIKILAPRFYKNKETDDEEHEIIYFRPVSVFDISATSGAELPSLDNKPIENTHAELLQKLLSYTKSKGIQVKFEKLGNTDGISKLGEITINSNQNETEQAITLIHEIAHELIHDTMEKRKELTTEIKELEAEAVSFIVSQHLGLPETNSDKYLSLYHKSYDLQESLECIHRVSTEIIKAIEGEGETSKEAVEAA